MAFKSIVQQDDLFAIVTDRLDRAAFHGFLGEGFLLVIGRLLVDKGISPVVIACETVRGGLTTEVAVDALVVHVELALNVVRILVFYFSHQI